MFIYIPHISTSACSNIKSGLSLCTSQQYLLLPCETGRGWRRGTVGARGPARLTKPLPGSCPLDRVRDQSTAPEPPAEEPRSSASELGYHFKAKRVAPEVLNETRSVLVLLRAARGSRGTRAAREPGRCCRAASSANASPRAVPGDAGSPPTSRGSGRRAPAPQLETGLQAP